MRIDIVAIGSHGDVRPTVALGLGLQRAGHTVRIVTLGGFEAFVRSHGLDQLSIGGRWPEIASTAEGQEWIARRASATGFLRGFVKVATSVVDAGIADYWAAGQDAEAIVATSLGLLVGVHVAERRRVPLVRVHTSPFTPTRYDWAGRWNLRTAVQGDLRAAAGAALRLVIWRRLRGTTDAARQRVLALPPSVRGDPFRVMDRMRIPVLDAYSPSVVTRPPDWGEWIHVTGYWFLDEPPGWRPPDELLDFLESGPPPVFVGFGSTPFPEPEAATDLVLRALARSGRRGVLLAGGSGLATGRLSDEVLSLESTSHEWLFRHVGAAVHHGGAGVTGAALRAGLPSVVVPVFADQPFWGQRVFDLGVGPRPIPARRLTETALAEAIRSSADTGMQQRAARLGERIRREDGVARAVELIQRHLRVAPR